MIGAHTGMNIKGLALSEMGDASAKEAPYQIHAPHFTVYFRTMLYDGDSLAKALSIFKSQAATKRYHFVFGDGQTDKRAVKVRAHSPEPAFPTLQKERGKLDGPKLVELANKIPIKGGNVENVVYDATALRMWVSYAKSGKEAYTRPYTYIDLKTIDADGNGKADLGE
jgi:hypothetical protein